MTTSKAISKRTEKQIAGFAVTLTPAEIYAIQDFAEHERGAALQRITAAASHGEPELVREILGTVDTCAGLAEKMGGLVERMAPNS